MRINLKKTIILIMATAFAAGMSLQTASASSGIDGAKLFKAKCKMCHKMEKKRKPPAVSNMTGDVDVLRSVIVDGRKSMPKFGKKLSPEKVEALIKFIQDNRN